MVSATEVAGILRVAFKLSESEIDDNNVVCFVRAMEKGIDICYSHTVSRSRPVGKGPWGPDTVMRMTLTPMLENTIRIGVMHELWGCCENRIRILPAPPNTSLKLINWQKVDQAELEGMPL